jgi:hypothetical protein
VQTSSPPPPPFVVPVTLSAPAAPSSSSVEDVVDHRGAPKQRKAQARHKRGFSSRCSALSHHGSTGGGRTSQKPNHGRSTTVRFLLRARDPSRG